MTAVSQFWGPGAGLIARGAGSLSDVVFNDADNAAACIFVAPKDGTIDRILVPVSGKTGTSTTVKINCAVVTVDSSGNPTTTPAGGSAIVAQTINAFTNSVLNTITLATPATVSAGDLLAAAMWPEGVVAPDASNNITVRVNAALHLAQLPAPADFATAWTRRNATPLLVPRYSDGSYARLFPLNAVAAPVSSAFNSTSTPDEYGAKFTLPFGCSCDGARVYIRPSAIGVTGVVRLLDSLDTLLASCTIAAGSLGTTGTIDATDVFWDAVALTAGATYRLTLAATHATATLIVPWWPVPDTNAKAACPEGANWGATTRVDGAGSWTDTALTLPLGFAIHMSDITLTAAGGGAKRVVI